MTRSSMMRPSIAGGHRLAGSGGAVRASSLELGDTCTGKASGVDLGSGLVFFFH